MKKFFVSAAVVAFVAVGFTSCKKDTCVECSASGTTAATTICEDDYTSVGGISWETYRDALLASPNCKKTSK